MKYAQMMLRQMERLGMNKRQLAERSGVPYMTVSGILKNGAAKAGLQNVLAICRALQIDPNVLSSANAGADMHWAAPLCQAYADSPELVRQCVCKILDLQAVLPPDHQ